MITVINKANKGLYNQLFEQVQEWLYTHDEAGEPVDLEDENARPLLGKATDPDTGEVIVDPETGEEVMETITSLEELFEFMYFITNFTPLYTRLPLDEEPFFIDADKRTISVPKDFATNGVSVQGDEVAEILFFKINRFFDATDLNECKIFIQWKSSEIDEQTGEPKQGVSKPWIQDIVSEPGYLIFGWPISSKITNTAGTVTFSVRFYRLDSNRKLIYSFSTLDQTVTIKPALDYEIENIGLEGSKIVVDDMSGSIMSRAVDSPASSGGLVAADPYWEPWVPGELTGWTQVDDPMSDPTNPEVLYEVMNLGLDNDNFSTKPIELSIAALSDDSGVVSYVWYKINKDGTPVTTLSDEETKFFKPVQYRETQDTGECIINKTYYYEDGNKFKAIALTEGVTVEDLIEEYETVYELVSTATLDEVGKYTATAKNRVGKSFSAPLEATTIFVPMPVEPVLGSLAATNNGILREEDTVELSVPVELFDEFGNDVSANGGKATYQWYCKSLDPEIEEADAIEEGIDAQLILTEDDPEGWYSVAVFNNLNKQAKKSTSEEVRVTKPAAKPAVTIDLENEDISLADAQAGLPVYVDNLEEFRLDGVDTVSYQWYQYRTTGHDFAADRAAARLGTYEINGDLRIDQLTGDTITDTVLRTSTEPLFIPPMGSNEVYFCEVINTYNGTTARSLSPFYNVAQ